MSKLSKAKEAFLAYHREAEEIGRKAGEAVRSKAAPLAKQGLERTVKVAKGYQKAGQKMTEWQLENVKQIASDPELMGLLATAAAGTALTVASGGTAAPITGTVVLAATGRHVSKRLTKKNARRNPKSAEEQLLDRLISLRILYQQLHWNAKGPSFYGEHLLFERLTDSLNEDIDTWAELILANEGDNLAGFTPIRSEDPIVAEQAIIYNAKPLIRQAQAEGRMDYENFLMGLIQNRMRAVYLLGRRGAQGGRTGARAKPNSRRR